MIDGIIKEPDCRSDGFTQVLVIDSGHAVCLHDKFGEVDGPQVAGFHGKQRLFTARVGALDFPYSRGGVVPVQPIQEDNSRVSVVPRLGDQGEIHIGRVQLAGRLARLGINQIVRRILFHGQHEIFSEADGDVEVV